MKIISKLLIRSCALFFILVICGCNSPEVNATEDSTQTSLPAPILTPVQVVTPHRGTIASFFETTSRVEAESRVEVLSKGAGQCTGVSVDVGDSVEAGQLLATLEKEELEAQVRQARITVQQQKTAYEIAERSYNEGIAASVDVDNTRFAYEQAKVALEMAELQLRNQTVYSPIRGIITRRVVQPGMVVSPGIPIFSIVDPGSYVLPVFIPEKEIARVQLEQKAYARIDAFPEYVFNTKVRNIHPSIDPLSGTLKVLLEFEPADRERLREAAFARIQLVMEMREDALLLPRDAVLEEEGRKFVFVAALAEADGASRSEEPGYIAKKCPITIGIEQGDLVEILDGVTDSDKVVVMGQHSLKPETPVKITNLEEEMTARAAITVEEALAAAGTRETLVSGDRRGHSPESLPF